MKPEILDRALKSVIPRQRIFENAMTGRRIVSSHKDGGKAVMTGTTIIAFPFKEGIIFAADRKITGGYMSILSVDFKKLFRIAPFTVIGGAGTLGDVQHVVSMMEELNSGFIGKFEYPLSIKG